MNKDLKPCPFCGGKADIKHEESKVGGDVIGHVYVQCLNKECKTMPRSIYHEVNQEKAIEAWNNRPREQELEEENRKLREALKTIGGFPASGRNILEIKTAKQALQQTKESE